MNEFNIDLDRSECFITSHPIFKVGDKDIIIAIHVKNQVIILQYSEFGDINIPKEEYNKLKETLTHVIVKYKKITKKTINELSLTIRAEELNSTFDNHPLLINGIYRLASDLNLCDEENKIKVFVNDAFVIESPHPNVILKHIPYVFFHAYVSVMNTEVKWNRLLDKFLYLPGKLYKFDRLLLIKKILEDSELKDKFNFSCNPNSLDARPDLLEELTEMMQLHDPTINNLKEWISLYARTLDLGINRHRNLIFPVELMNEHILSIITETWFACPTFTTEKVYFPLITGMPFIILNDKFINKIHSMGFKTYQELLGPIDKEKDDINHATEINLMIKRIKQFIERCHNDASFVDQVKETIEHNKKNSKRIMLEHLEDFNRYLSGIMLNNEYDYSLRKWI